jgi:hypothetical protein
MSHSSGVIFDQIEAGMKLEDMPTPEHDALFGNCNDRSLGDELCMIYILAHSLEQRLALAVAENARLKAAMDKYSEDEMLCNIDAALQPDRRKGERRKYTRITADRRQKSWKSLGWRDPRLISDAELAQDWVKSKRSE